MLYVNHSMVSGMVVGGNERRIGKESGGKQARRCCTYPVEEMKIELRMEVR